MATKPSAPELYPDITDLEDVASQHAGVVDPTQYRLQEISLLRRQLEVEYDSRVALHKKYNRSVNVLEGIDAASLAAGMGLGIGGATLLSSIATAPIALGLEMGALSCALLCAACKPIRRMLAVKAKKHTEIKTLAMAKLNTISGIVSKALADGHISAVEFQLVLDELTKYRQMRDDIRARAKKDHGASASAAAIDEEIKQSLIKQGRNEARAQLIKKLASP